jgi:hypothetical protein
LIMRFRVQIKGLNFRDAIELAPGDPEGAFL